jgi:L-rhamnose mutarotase
LCYKISGYLKNPKKEAANMEQRRKQHREVYAKVKEHLASKGVKIFSFRLEETDGKVFHRITLPNSSKEMFGLVSIVEECPFRALDKLKSASCS